MPDRRYDIFRWAIQERDDSQRILIPIEVIPYSDNTIVITGMMLIDDTHLVREEDITHYWKLNEKGYIVTWRML